MQISKCKYCTESNVKVYSIYGYGFVNGVYKGLHTYSVAMCKLCLRKHYPRYEK